MFQTANADNRLSPRTRRPSRSRHAPSRRPARRRATGG
jgi:hypothetical protein